MGMGIQTTYEAVRAALQHLGAEPSASAALDATRVALRG
jgi:hypothetical protein